MGVITDACPNLKNSKKAPDLLRYVGYGTHNQIHGLI